MEKKIYKVLGKSTKENKKIEGIMEFIRNSFNEKGLRLGLPNFTKKLGKYNEQKGTLQASSVPSVKEIQTACRLLAVENRGNGKDWMPAVVENNGTVTVENRGFEEFDVFYPIVKQSFLQTVDANKFLASYLEKHKEEIDFASLAMLVSGYTD